MELIVMRHGRTRSNELRRYVGSTDEPLSEQGRVDARTAGVRQDVGLVYVSPLMRARETASICFPQARQVVCDSLRELDFGCFEGKSADEMADDPLYRAWVDGGCEGTCPGGECRAQMMQRVADTAETILREAADRGDERIVIVAHGGTAMALMESFNSEPACDPYRYFSWHVGNCEGYVININPQVEPLKFDSYRRFCKIEEL